MFRHPGGIVIDSFDQAEPAGNNFIHFVLYRQFFAVADDRHAAFAGEQEREDFTEPQSCNNDPAFRIDDE